MLDAVAYERSCALVCSNERPVYGRGGAASETLVTSRNVRCCCFACGGTFSVRTGDFQRCTSCRAENYCPRTDVSVEERVRRWFCLRGIA